MRIGIVAGESSGDLLAAGLIGALKRRIPGAVFEGVAGPRMVAQGCTALFPADKLAVMGLVEVLSHFREISAIRRHLLQHFRNHPPDVFIGVDSPDFNLPLERKLRAAGIPTVHYVSPTVWAWRQYRVRGIARSVDLILTLFPFEADFYRDHQVPVSFVGHPLADMIPLRPDRGAARAQLGLPQDVAVVALLPGSRVGELERHADSFVETVRWCLERRPDVRFVAPLATAETRRIFEAALQRHGQIPVSLLDGQSREAMTAADAVLLASGTAALEALLLKRPMVVTYRLAPLTYWIARRLLKIPYCSMPNLLAGRQVAPEFIQDAATPENMGQAVLEYLEHPEEVAPLEEIFTEIHGLLKQGANEKAARAVLKLLGKAE